MQNTKSYFNARPFDKMDSTTVFSREFTPKPYIAFYIWAREVCAEGTKDVGGCLQKPTPLDLMSTHMDK